MIKKIVTILLLGITLLTFAFLSGCTQNNGEKIVRNTKVARAESSLKEIEIFALGIDTPELNFSKSATVSANNIAHVTPQTSGKITNIAIKIGDKVKKEDLLISLGDSLNTDMTDLQYQTALDTLNLALESQAITNESVKQSVQMAGIAVQTAYEAYQNALESKESAKDSNFFN